MRRLNSTSSRTISGLIAALTLLFYPPFSIADEPLSLDSVQVEQTLEGVEVQLKASRSFPFVTYFLENPDRIIIDPAEEKMDSSLPEKTVLSKGLVRLWSLISPAGEAPSSHQVDYVSFELTAPCDYWIESRFGKAILHIKPKKEPTPASEELAVVSPAPEEGVWTLNSALNYGLARHRPVAVARQEVLLAEMKIREAHRALFPAATLKTSWTNGKASELNFEEFSGGIQLEHPIYYSGRLTDTYQQSLVNLEIAEKRQNKVKADFAAEISQVYFQYVGAKASVLIQEDLVQQIKILLDQSRQRFEKGLLTRLELLNVETQVNQAKFQLATAENDLLLARAKFLQRMSLDLGASIEVPSELVFSPLTEIDLDEAMRLSARYRPDILVNTLLVELNEYEERIAQKKGDLRVDLTSFLGASGAAFETEPLVIKKDYSVGFKVSNSFGPHGGNVSYTKTKTSPQLGQTTRTESTVYAGELGLFNQYQGMSEVQQARVGLEKAKSELQEVKAVVTQEVQESYISYQKAMIQTEYAREKIAFREEQVKILKTQASLNEVLPSQVVEAVMRLADERSSEIQAKTNYYVALAKLNKAIGLPDHYR